MTYTIYYSLSHIKIANKKLIKPHTNIYKITGKHLTEVNLLLHLYFKLCQEHNPSMHRFNLQ